MNQITEIWNQKRGDGEVAATQLAPAIRSGTGVPSPRWAPGEERSAGLSPTLLEVTGDALLARFDPEWGGFGRAPKFPQPAMVETALRAAAKTGREDLLS